MENEKIKEQLEQEGFTVRIKNNKIFVIESWDESCLNNYRLKYNKPKMTYEDALNIMNKSILPKGFHLIQSRFIKKPTMLLSESVFEYKLKEVV